MGGPPVRQATEHDLRRIVEIEVAGYVTAGVVDDNAHVAQVSVDPVFAGRAVGRVLMEFVESWGREQQRRATTLTTFRDVPWNGPYYARPGYRMLSTLGPELARLFAEELTWPGLSDAPRIAMVKPNEGSTD